MRFDHALAAETAEALRDAARQLQHVMTLDSPMARTARDGWRGPHADRFGGIYDAWETTTAPGLIDELVRWARVVEAASELASELRARRDREAEEA